MQNWNNILSFIKRNLGAKLNLLEMSDEEIIEGLKEDTLPYFSQYVPATKYTLINSTHKLRSLNLMPGENTETYIIPLADDEYIIDVNDVYPSQADTILDEMGLLLISEQGMLDTVMSNTYLDMAEYMRVRNTWQYYPPNKISFDREITGAIIEYHISHKSLETIAPDMYNLIFKPLCLAYTKKWLSALRSKYEGLTTPFGEVAVNWQKLEQDATDELSKIEQMLISIPPKRFLECSV